MNSHVKCEHLSEALHGCVDPLQFLATLKYTTHVATSRHYLDWASNNNCSYESLAIHVDLNVVSGHRAEIFERPSNDFGCCFIWRLFSMIWLWCYDLKQRCNVGMEEQHVSRVGNHLGDGISDILTHQTNKHLEMM